MATTTTPPPQMTLHLDLMSQPSRACFILREMCGLNDAVEVRAVRLDRGDHKKGANPLAKVPFLSLPGDDRTSDAFANVGCLPESGAILPFLAASFPERVPEHWQRPSSSLAAAARHDAAILWVQTTVRVGATRLIFNRVIGPRVFGQQSSASTAEVARHGAQVLSAAIAELERVWLCGGKRHFIGYGEGAAGQRGESPSAADLLCLCELDQLVLLDMADPEGGACLRDFVPEGSVTERYLERVRVAAGGEGGAYGRAVRTLRAAGARWAAERGGGGGVGGTSKL
jgi:glutathione S-transferase